MSSLSPASVPVLLMVRELGIGGTERQLVETARFLSRERFIPHVGCFRPDGPRRAELESAGIPILHLPLYSPGSKVVLSGRNPVRSISSGAADSGRPFLRCAAQHICRSHRQV